MRVASVVVLAQVGRMAIGAHVVPILIDAGPVASVTRRDLLAGIQKEPPLAATLARPRIPGDSQRLQTSAGHRDQILLQRIYAERKFDFVIMQRAVGAVGAYHEARSISIEARCDAVVIEAGAIEVAQHRRRVRRLHRQLMVRAAPQSFFALVTACALGGSDEFRAGYRWCRRRWDRRRGWFAHPARE